MTVNLRVMTLDEIDRALADWRERLQRVDENLLALEQEPTFQFLETMYAGDQEPLSGQTAARAIPALEAMRELFQQRHALSDVIDHAARLRGAVSRFFPTRESLLEISQLLRGPAIKLPAIKTPLAQRGLLSSAERDNAITPEALITAMIEAFERARDAVIAIDQAWERLIPTLTSADQELVALENRARALGVEASADLARGREQVDALRQRIARDPLGATAGVEGQLQPLLQQLRARVETIAQQREQVQAQQTRARALLLELRRVHADAQAALERCRQEIADPPAPQTPLDDAQIDGLATWLERLDTTVAGGRWPAAQVGLTRWMEAAEGYLASERAAYQANNAPLAQREELRGRLSARRAQLQSLQARGLVMESRLELKALELEAGLKQRPTPVAALSPQVEAFEDELTALLRRRNP